MLTTTGVRQLKNRLSHYVRAVEGGRRIAVTAHGRIVAELVPPGTTARAGRSRYDELVAEGVIKPARETGDPLGGWPGLKLPAGTAAALLDWDRDDDHDREDA